VRTLYWLILLSFGVTVSGRLVGQEEGGIYPDPVATVNGEPLARDAFYRRLLQAAGRKVLEQLVEEELVRQEATKRKITISDDEMDKRLAADEAPKIAQRRYSEERYATWLELYRGALGLQMLKERLVSDKVTVSDAEVERAYTENRDKYPITVPEGRRVSFILFPKEKEDTARQVSSQLDRNPEKFGELARKHSISETRERGGEYPYYVRLSQNPGADERAIFALEKVDDISRVVSTTEGLFIIQLDDIQPEITHDYEDVKETLREVMRRQRVLREYATWRGEQMQNAKVEVFFDDTGPGGSPEADG